MPLAKNRAAVLEQARAALLPAAFDGALAARGRGEVHGVPVAWTRICDAAGRVIDTVDGALGHAAGFDGTHGWRIDETGMPGALELGDLDELIAAAAVWSGTWCREDGPLVIDAAISLDGALVRLAARTRAGRRRFRLVVDSRTWRATRLERAGRDDAAYVFDDYRPAACGLVPHLLVRREAHLADTLRLESVAPATAPIAYGLSREPSDDTTFDPGAAPPEHRWARNRLPVVRAQLDGHDAGWFALDTGASASAIEAAVAARLKLPELGRRFVRTADGASGAPYRRAGALRVGGATVRGPLFLELDLTSFGKAAGVSLAGVLGYDLFRRAAITLAPAEDRVSIEPPPVSDGEGGDDGWLPLRFEDGLPAIPARFPGPGGPGEALLAIDTGSALSLTLAAGAAPAFELHGGARVSLLGAGGAASAMARSIAWLELAGHRIEDVDALVARPGEGALGEAEPGAVAGLIGMGLLRDFAVTFDYPRRRLQLRRTPRAPRRARPR